MASNKQSLLIAEQQRNFLKLTLDHLGAENETTKESISDLKITLQTNKDLIKKYLENTGNKDVKVQKKLAILAQLKQKHSILSQHIKDLY